MMGIQIKPYYCPKCQSFKEQHDVNEFLIYHYCKSCGTECYDTEVLLEMIFSEKATALLAEEKKDN